VENRILGPQNKIDIKQKNSETKESRPSKGIHKNSVIASRDETCESWALKNKKGADHRYM
jgi:hypothetical protein